MIVHMMGEHFKDDTPVKMSKRQFWNLWLKIKSDKLTEKERDVAIDFILGESKPIKGNYKTYVERLQKKGIPLKKLHTPDKVTLQINVEIDESIS